MAVSPISVPQAEIHDPPLPAATQRVVAMSDVQLAGLASDLTRFVNAAVNAPGDSLDVIRMYGDNLGLIFDQIDALPPQQAIGALALLFLTVPNEAVAPFFNVLTANVPGGPGGFADYDFFDAFALNLRSATSLPLTLATLPAAFVYFTASGAATPAEALTLITTGLLKIPFGYARPWAAALANVLPEPLGGTPNILDPEAPGQGLVFSAFTWAENTYAAALNDIFAPFAPQQQMLAKQQAGAQVVVADPWPPNAETVRMSLDTLGDNLRTLPGDLRLELTRDRNTVVAYLDQGRPLDAVRFLASRAIVFSLGQASSYAGVAATLAPPPLGQLSNGDDGLILGGFTRIGRAGLDLADEIAPDPVKITASKQIAPSGINAPQGNSGNIVTLNIPDPKKNVEEFTNVGISQGADNKDGTTVTKIDNNRPKIGSNVRAVVREVRNDIRQTVKDVRQGVHDVVKAVTGLGKKKDEAPKTEAAKSE